MQHPYPFRQHSLGANAPMCHPHGCSSQHRLSTHVTHCPVGMWQPCAPPDGACVARQLSLLHQSARGGLSPPQAGPIGSRCAHMEGGEGEGMAGCMVLSCVLPIVFVLKDVTR